MSKSEDLFVFPGHPITVALFIVEQFDSLEEASEPVKETDWVNAMTNEFVYGSNQAIKAALDVLGEIRNGQLLTVVRKLSDDLWDGCLAKSEKYGDIRSGTDKSERAYALLMKGLKEKWGWKFV